LAKDIIIESFRKEFQNRKILSREELFAFYSQFEPDLKETTFRWRIHYLKSNKIITPYTKGLFSLAYKPNFKPEIEDKEKKIYAKVAKQFPDLKQCIWSTKSINEFMLHIPNKFITVLEVEQNALDPVFHFFKDIHLRDVYLQPDEKEMQRYISDAESPVILRSLVSQAPLQKINNAPTITIEKMIVDLYCEKNIFSAYQGNELVHIVNNAYSRYAIDFTKLFNYSKRRRKEKDIKEFFLDKTDISQNILND
jgi:uncharacterized protein DUF6577